MSLLKKYEKRRYTGVLITDKKIIAMVINRRIIFITLLVQNTLNWTIQCPAAKILLTHVICTWLRRRTFNTTGTFRCSLSKCLYFYCELYYIWVKCGLGIQNLVLYTGVFVITGFLLSGLSPIQFTVILPGPKKYFVITGTLLYRGSLYRGSTVQVILREPRGAGATRIIQRIHFSGQYLTIQATPLNFI